MNHLFADFFKRLLLLVLCACLPCLAMAAFNDAYDICWTSHSRNSSESMPCGGGDIGLNVWVENGELLCYVSRSGTFDEHNTLLKLGRLRLSFEGGIDSLHFSQVLHLADGSVRVKAGEGREAVDISLWVDVFRPVVHIQAHTKKRQRMTVAYESWRYCDRPLRKNESFANSYKWAPPKGLTTKSDKIEAGRKSLCWWHQNPHSGTLFDVAVAQQGLESIKDSLYNPLSSLVFGGQLSGRGLHFKDSLDGLYQQTDYRAWRYESRFPMRRHQAKLVLHTWQGNGQKDDVSTWKTQLQTLARSVRPLRHRRASQAWWKAFWQRSHICIQADSVGTEAWRIGRNYQLFRYQLACNAYGSWPTKFNGGLFTFDPAFVNSSRPFTPDFRNWGGGTFTAQNQRLVYFPMLKSGDVDLMLPQFDFYRRLMPNAEWRSRVYWQHQGACFTEQMENFGLPNPSEYGWKRPEGYDPGMEYNKWLEYQWDTSLEFCFMMLEAHRYAGLPIDDYLPLIESCLRFFDEHYRYLAAQRNESPLDSQAKLVLYPGSACETYKQARNATSTIAALRVVTERLLALPLDASRRQHWQRFLQTLPDIPLREIEGRTCLAPAESWERINNTEAPLLYPVYPWRLYGPLSLNRDIAVNTFLYDSDVQRFYSHVGWKQYNIFAACLGLTDEAKRLCLLKFRDSDHRFPTFWGPGFDWTPDHNWGGSAAIGLQEMLLQTAGDSLLLFPAWPKEWDVSFKLHAPKQTIVEATLKQGKLVQLEVSPASRRDDVYLLLDE